MKKKSLTVRDLPEQERPRERLQNYGPEALSAQELLAVLLGRGIAMESVMQTAQRLLANFGTLKGISEATIEELCEIRGIGKAKACQLQAAFSLAGRTGKDEAGPKPKINSSEDVVRLVSGRLAGQKREHFLALLLDTRNQVMKITEISIGSLDSSVVHPREVFKEAILASCSSMVFVHNHPSGDPSPSDDDIQLTKRLKQAGEIFGIDVLDHIIIGDNRHLSLKGKGLI